MEKIDPKIAFEKIRQLYESQPSAGTYNALITGGIGTGKTMSLRTAVKPVLLFSFDTGGGKVLRKEIEAGEVMVVDVSNPADGYERFEKIIEAYLATDFFSYIGTLSIDSLTSLISSMMSTIVKKQGRKYGIPAQQDYLIANMALDALLRKLMSLPCDFILTAHLEATKDDITGLIEYRINTYRSLKIQVPLLFDEVYVAIVNPTPPGATYSFLTQATGKFEAKSRYSSGGKLDTVEPQDYKIIRQKVGLAVDDKKINL